MRHVEWRNPPLLSVTSDQDGTVHYDWGSGDTTVAADAGSPVSLGIAPEGVSTLRAFCVSSLGETGTVPQVTISVDSELPPFPDVPMPSLTGGRVHLAWDPVTDAMSGLAGYTVYRNLVGPPFSAGDAVAFVTGPSFTDDAGSGSGVWYYAVSARDRAGNESMLSDAVRTSADATPPSAPGDLQAWLNGDGFARMSWLPSIDLGTGVAYYVVERSVSGLPMSAVAMVPASADFWDDFDPEAADAAGVSYQVTAFDRAGNASTPAGPAGRGTDNGAPSTPAGLSLLVLPTPDGSDAPVLGVDFRTSWGASTDIVSGIARYAVYYGPDPASPSSVRRVSDPFSVFVTGLESATWTFGVRAEDRAGNVSELSGPATGHGATVDRVSGSDRVGTAVAVSAATFTSAHTVVFASAAAYPDGLSGASLAGALHAPSFSSARASCRRSSPTSSPGSAPSTGTSSGGRRPCPRPLSRPSMAG